MSGETMVCRAVVQLCSQSTSHTTSCVITLDWIKAVNCVKMSCFRLQRLTWLFSLWLRAFYIGALMDCMHKQESSDVFVCIGTCFRQNGSFSYSRFCCF